MLKKLVYALALTGLASGQAFALTNPGFETGTTAGWSPTIPTVGLSVAAYGTSGAVVSVVDDYSNLVPTEILSRAVDAVPTGLLSGTTGVGSYFGLLETCPAGTAALSCTSTTTFTFNLSGPVSVYGDYFLARLFTADYDSNVANDSVTITYSGVSGSTSDVVSVQSMNPTADMAIADSGWQAFAVPVGTQNIVIQVENAGATTTDALYNRPIVAIDYASAIQVSPVPEADASAMMLAGLGVLGMVARRRNSRKAK